LMERNVLNSTFPNASSVIDVLTVVQEKLSKTLVSSS